MAGGSWTNCCCGHTKAPTPMLRQPRAKAGRSRQASCCTYTMLAFALPAAFSHTTPHVHHPPDLERVQTPAWLVNGQPCHRVNAKSTDVSVCRLAVVMPTRCQRSCHSRSTQCIYPVPFPQPIKTCLDRSSARHHSMRPAPGPTVPANTPPNLCGAGQLTNTQPLNHLGSKLLVALLQVLQVVGLLVLLPRLVALGLRHARLALPELNALLDLERLPVLLAAVLDKVLRGGKEQAVHGFRQVSGWVGHFPMVINAAFGKGQGSSRTSATTDQQAVRNLRQTSRGRASPGTGCCQPSGAACASSYSPPRLALARAP